LTDPRLEPDSFDAVLFDLDGVLTSTASLHSACWAQTFDGFLERWAARTGAPQPPFDPGADYVRYVDGKPRDSGVRDFLASRSISLPEGPVDAGPGDDSIRAVSAAKQALVARALARGDVEAFPGSVAWLRRLRRAGVRTAVVSSSENCAQVLAAAGIADLFDARVDGVTAREHGITGKPAPDTFLEAARRLGVEPGRAVVVEDALAGVAAGRAGGFGLVIGVDRSGSAEELRAHGADIVVGDLDEMLA
jgi:alpha,alpha-trehalose phosphorylase